MMSEGTEKEHFVSSMQFIDDMFYRCFIELLGNIVERVTLLAKSS
jgi:hypothetical protein